MPSIEIDGSLYRFGDMKKVLSVKEFRDQYPNKVPYSSKNEAFDRLKKECFNNKRSVKNAKSLMQRGFIEAIMQRGKERNQAVKEFNSMFGVRV